MKQRCTLSKPHVAKSTKTAVEKHPSEETEEIAEPPRKRRVVGKAFESVKRMVASAIEPVSPGKDGARSFPVSQSPVNRAEVVIKVRRKDSDQSIAAETGSLFSLAPSSLMGPPPSSIPSEPSRPSPAPSALSHRASGSSLRDLAAEYELLRLRRALNASQEELSLVKRLYSDYKDETENYIDSMHRKWGGYPEDEGGSSSKGKGRAL